MAKKKPGKQARVKQEDEEYSFRNLIYARDYSYKVRLQRYKPEQSDQASSEIQSYWAEPCKPDLTEQKQRFRYFGFVKDKEAIDCGDIDNDEIFYLAHMFIPDYFEQLQDGTLCPIFVPDISTDTPPNPNPTDRSLLGLFMLKQFSTKGRPNKQQTECRKRGEFGCPLTLQIPIKPEMISGEKNELSGEQLGYFTFNRMKFYPFLMIDYTVCYYVCDANGKHDWNYNEEKNRAKYPEEIYPLVALDAPVSYEPTLGIWMTRSAHLEPYPKEKKPRRR